MSYTPTKWVDGVTPVNATNLNKLENAVAANSKALDALGDDASAVLYTDQELTEEQKAQARKNIGAASFDEIADINTTLDGIVEKTSNLAGGKMLPNYYVNTTDGAIYESTSNRNIITSEKIVVKPDTKYTISFWGVPVVAFSGKLNCWDVDGNWLGAAGGAIEDNYTLALTLPNTAYIIPQIAFADGNDNINNVKLMLEEGWANRSHEYVPPSSIRDSIAREMCNERVGVIPQIFSEEQKAQARNNIGALADTSNIPAYWENAVAEVVKKISDFQDIGGADTFTFGFITDTHTDVNSNGNFAKLMERVMNDCKIPICLHGGDYIAGYGIISKDDLIKQHLHNDYIFRNIENKMLTAQGNHESVFGVTENYDSNLTNAEIYSYVFRKNQSKCGLVFGDTGTYFYKDIPAQKARYIVLNCYEFETAMDENQVVTSNNKLRTAKFGAEQLTWLANVALNVPENYTIVICSHNAPYRNTDLSELWQTATTVMLDCDVALGIVNAFRNKTTYSHSETIGSGTTQEFYSMDFDFTQRNGELACWIAGHTHMDGIFDLDGLMVITTVNCSDHIAITDAPNKVKGTDTEYAMDFVCVNKKTKACNIVRLGAELEKNTSGSISNVTNLANPTSSEWLTDQRVNSVGEIVSGSGYAVSNFIPMEVGDVIHVKGINPVVNFTVGDFYTMDKTQHAAYQLNVLTADYDPSVFIIKTGDVFAAGTTWARYFRISGQLRGSANDIVITVNEEIKSKEYPGRGFNY